MDKKLESVSANIVDKILATGSSELGEMVIQKLKERLSSKTATVYYAGELEEAEKQLVTAKLKNKFTEMMSVEFIEDGSLIAGIKIRYQDYVYDDSLVGKFR